MAQVVKSIHMISNHSLTIFVAADIIDKITEMNINS